MPNKFKSNKWNHEIARRDLSNSLGCNHCPGTGSEDGFCPGP